MPENNKERLTPKIKVAIADTLFNRYAEDDGYGGFWIAPLPEKVEGFFGEPLLVYHPTNPQKKIRGFIRSLEDSQILGLLAHLSKDDEKLETALNEILKLIGLEIRGGKIMDFAETSLELPQEERMFLSELESLGFKEDMETFKKGFDALKKRDPLAASSSIGLAFDALFKKLLISLGLEKVDFSLGKLVTKAKERGLIEDEAEAVFQGWVCLRNLPPQHSVRGKIDTLTPSLALLTVHTARVLAAYLLRRYSIMRGAK